MDTLLFRSILQTVTYYDVMDYPMTSFEIWRHLIVHDAQTVWTIGAVRRALVTPELREYLAEQNGMYFLIGRENLISERRRRERISLLKTKRLLRYVWWLRMVPFVRGIFLTGRLSFHHGEEGSDLDLLVVAREKHIWMCRLLFTIATQVMGVRRYGNKQADRICLNYYITDHSLEVPTKDLFAAHEYSFIVPLFGADIFSHFVEANRWIRRYKPHYMVDVLPGTWLQKDHFLLRFFRTSGEVLLGFPFLGDKVAEVQKKKIMNNPNTSLPGALIIANDDHLVFLPKPHGPEIYEEYRKRFDALEIPW